VGAPSIRPITFYRRAAYAVIALLGAGVVWHVWRPAPDRVTGVVRYAGATPTPARGPYPMRGGGPTAAGDDNVFDTRSELTPGGGVAGVLVYVLDPPRSQTGAGPHPGVDLVFRDFDFVEQAKIVWVGQRLVVRNAWPALTNAHATRQTPPPGGRDVGDGFNVALPTVGSSFPYAFESPGRVEVRSDIFQWARCQVLVTDHPWAAVTDESGRFEMPGLPEGRYTFEAYHPKLGVKRLTGEVRGGGKIVIAY